MIRRRAEMPGRAVIADMNNYFPKDIRQFIDGHLHSLAQLEVLLTLHNEPGRYWTVEEVTNTLYLQSEMASQLLLDLSRDGFASEQLGAYCYGPTTAEVHELIGRLGVLYKERRVAVTTEICTTLRRISQTPSDGEVDAPPRQ